MNETQFTTGSGLVYKKIADVAAEISRVGIEKAGYNDHDKYYFRGIDAVYSVLSPILAANRLMILPRVVERHSEPRKSAAGKELLHTNVLVEFDLAAEDGSKHTVSCAGEAMDRGDKSLNKAISAAYKYMVFTTFCPPFIGAMDDSESETHQLEGANTNEGEWKIRIDAAAGDREQLLALWKEAQAACGSNVAEWNKLKALFPARKQ